MVMKNNKLTFLKIAIVAIFGIATVLGCEKKEVLQNKEKTETNPKEEVSIDVLRKYLADLINVSVERITYNEKNEQFQFDGFDQRSRKDLTESYQRNFINR